MSHSCCRSVTLTYAFSFLLFTSSYTRNVSSSQVFLWSQPAFEPQHRPPTLSAQGLASVTHLGLVCQSVIKKTRLLSNWHSVFVTFRLTQGPDLSQPAADLWPPTCSWLINCCDSVKPQGGAVSQIAGSASFWCLFFIKCDWQHQPHSFL